MKNDLFNAVDILKKEKYTCVLCKGDKVVACTKRGVSPLVDFIDTGADLRGFSAADKVVGNAAAFLYVLLGVESVYALVVSEAALQTLNKHGVRIQYDALVKNIINRARTGNCPMEEAVKNISAPQSALAAIKLKLKQLQSSN